MTKFQKISFLLLRLSLGCMFLYAGMSHLLDPKWSAGGLLNTAKTFPGFYHWLASPAILPITSFINPWALTLLGVALILGIFLRLASFLGALLMFLYYLPILDFPYPNAHAFIVDEHIIYICALLVLAAMHAGRTWGLDSWIARKYPRFAAWAA